MPQRDGRVPRRRRRQPSKVAPHRAFARCAPDQRGRYFRAVSRSTLANNAKRRSCALSQEETNTRTSSDGSFGDAPPPPRRRWAAARGRRCGARERCCSAATKSDSAPRQATRVPSPEDQLWVQSRPPVELHRDRYVCGAGRRDRLSRLHDAVQRGKCNWVDNPRRILERASHRKSLHGGPDQRSVDTLSRPTPRRGPGA